MSLLCVGSVAYDVIELPGREPVEVLGGSATWFCTAAGFLARPWLVAAVGDDFRDDDAAFLEARGTDVAGMERKTGKTFRWHGRYHADLIGRDSLATEPGVFAEFSPVIPREWRSPDVLFLGNIHPSLQGLVLAQCRDARFVALDTIQCWIESARDDLVRLLPRVDLLFLNDDEVRLITGEYHLPTAARALLSMGAKALVLKRGEHGASLWTDRGLALFPAWPVDAVVDPTGAGDCFAGGALGYLDRAGDFGPEALRRAMAVGTVVASYCVEGFGPRALGDVRPTSVRNRLDAWLKAVSVDGGTALTHLDFG
jgi:sugar/nucleoside kinase (ribokinase family)